MGETLSYHQALSAVLARAAARPPRQLEVALEGAVGLVSARDVLSRSLVPPFPSANLDGFAVRSAELARAGDGARRLRVVGHVAAGDAPPAAAAHPPPGSAWEITTGAPMPEGFDAVVPIEEATVRRASPERVEEFEVPGAVAPAQNVRPAGADFAAGAPVISAGTLVGPRHVLALAAVGEERVAVRAPPRVALLSTGNELAAASARALAPGQIRNATLPYLRATIRRLGAELVHCAVVRDELPALRDALRAALDLSPEIVVTTGGVSVGRHDLVAEAAEAAGWRVVFHRAAIRPGKPILFAERTAGGASAPGPALFGLPGNPGATAAGLRFFVQPYLRALAGLGPEVPARAALADVARKPAGVRCFLAARLAAGPSGLTVEILRGQASFKASAVAGADAWAVLPEELAELDRGALVDVYPAA